MIDPWTLMVAGDFVGAIIASFTNVMGGWFFAAMLFAISAMVYLKTSNSGLTIFVTMLVGFSFTALMPDANQAYAVVGVLAVIVLAIVLYKIIARG